MVTILVLALTALLWLAQMAFDAKLPFLVYVTQGFTALSAVRLAESALFALLGPRGQGRGASDRLRVMVSLFLYGAAALGWLKFCLGVEVSGLLATSAVVSVILGLALQPTLGALFSGLSLEIERPIQLGDYVVKGAVEGQVEALKWRSLFVRTSRNTRFVLPNSSLTADAVEVIGADTPSQQSLVFTVAASVPPVEVLAVAEEVLASGVADVCSDPPPSAVLLGGEPNTGALRYAARYYTLAWLDRTTTSSRVYVRLWYALSRRGIALQPAVLAVDATGVPLPIMPPMERQDPVPTGAAAHLAGMGRLLRFSPGERIETGGGAAVVVSGSVREEVLSGEGDEASAVAALLAAHLEEGAPPRIDPREVAVIAGHAATWLGPIAWRLADGYAALTDDPHLVYAALAEAIPDPAGKTALRGLAPTHPSRTLWPGGVFGWAQVLGREAADARWRVTNGGAAILLLEPAEARRALADPTVVAAVLAAGEPGMAELTAHDLSSALARIDGPAKEAAE